MAPAAARAALESLLREHRLDTTLTTALPLEVQDAERLAPSGLEALDAHLLGGLPRGEVSEITGPRSSGRTSLLVALMTAATSRGEVVALVDTLDRFDPPSAEAAGVHLDHLLWVRGQDVPLSRRCLAPDWEPSRPRPGRFRASLVDRALDRALKAVNLVVQAGGFGLVAIDLADVPGEVVRALPFTTWMRLQRVLEGSDTACVILAADPTARSAGGVSIRLEPRRASRLEEVPSSRPDPGDPAAPSGPAAGRAADPRARAFHQAVLASRKPFVRGADHAAPAGRWVGPRTNPRRLRGLEAHASVVRAHRRAQSSAHVSLDFGE